MKNIVYKKINSTSENDIAEEIATELGCNFEDGNIYNGNNSKNGFKMVITDEKYSLVPLINNNIVSNKFVFVQEISSNLYLAYCKNENGKNCIFNLVNYSQNTSYPFFSCVISEGTNVITNEKVFTYFAMPKNKNYKPKKWTENTTVIDGYDITNNGNLVNVSYSNCVSLNKINIQNEDIIDNYAYITDTFLNVGLIALPFTLNNIDFVSSGSSTNDGYTPICMRF